MALKKKSFYRISLLFKLSNSDESAPVPSNASPLVQKNDGRLRPVSQQLSPRPADGAGWNAGHQRAVSAQLQPPPVSYGGQIHRKAVSNERLRPTTPNSRQASSNLRASPSTPNLVPNRSPYLQPAHGSSPNLQIPSPANSRPGTASSTNLSPVFPAALDGPGDFNNGAKIKRKSGGLFGGRKNKKEEEKRPTAWVCGKELVPYDLRPLLNGQVVRELWDENGDAFIYLFPKQSGRGPSFKVDSQIFSSSAKLTKWAFGSVYSMPTAAQSNAAVAQQASHITEWRHVSTDAGNRQVSAAVPGTPPLPASAGASYTDGSEDSRDSRGLDPLEPGQPIHLHLPLNLSDKTKQPTPNDPASTEESDIDALISARNLFAFLVGQSLIATRSRPSFFHIFTKISQGLSFYQFSNLDGSTFGEVAHFNFESVFYGNKAIKAESIAGTKLANLRDSMNVKELRLNDVRASREKTIEGIVLGEAMRSVMLYNEAVTHAVGRYREIKAIKSPKYTMISNKTVERLELGSIDLDGRIKTMTQKLSDFQFYGLFQGTLNSSSSVESRQLNFDRWKSGYHSTRKWFMTYQKGKWGSWPPKVGKKNNLQTDGLNRTVLRDLYADVCLLYDLLVDRTSLTTRAGDLAEEFSDSADIIPRTLRKVLAEYDRSTPPVLPPIPFDVPMLPKIDDKRDITKKLKKSEVGAVLAKSYNADANATTHAPILESFRHFDFDNAYGLTIQHVGDLRCGQWLFLYAVLQTLPWLVVDAPALEYTDGVEYFLCVAPRSGVPWAREDPMMNRNWYGVAGSDKIVSLPSDLLTHGVEGTFRRSYCWTRAEQWTAKSSILKAAAAETLQAPLPPPPGAPVFGAQVGAQRSRASSPESMGQGSWSKRQSVVDLGLEALPLPQGVQPDVPDSPARSRPASAYVGDPSITFDAILGSVEQEKVGKKKK